MNKIILTVLLSVVAGAGLIFGYLHWKNTPVTTPVINKTGEDVAYDLATFQKYAICQPSAQMWLFDNQQKITVKVVHVNKIETGYAVYANVNAVTTVQVTAEDAPKEPVQQSPNKSTIPATPKTENVTIKLTGMAKLNYDYVDGTYSLVSVESISLKASQGE